MEILDYSSTKNREKETLMFLDLKIKEDELIPNIIRIFNHKVEYKYYLYAEFKETNV